MTARASGSRRESRTLSVDEVVLRVRNLIDYDETLAHVTVEGELTDFKRHVSGHVYFTLKGLNASLACVMFRAEAAGQLLWPRAGDKVAVVGSVRLYEARGAVQIYARKLLPLGVGAAARAKEELRLKLEKEGLFSPGRKRPIPSYPRTVACVTSGTGAAVRDVIKQYRMRYPVASLVVVPCLVQGVRAAESAAAALRRAAGIPGVEAILLVRGGGAKEDLSPFDDEELVREVARSSVPVVTGLGHEVDESLCDLAADLREPTPTAAAASVFPDRNAEFVALMSRSARLYNAASDAIRSRGRKVRDDAEALLRSAGRALVNSTQSLDAAADRLDASFSRLVEIASARLDELERSLNNLSPRALARRGYSFVLHDGRPLTSAGEARQGGLVTVQLLDGDVSGTVGSVTPRARSLDLGISQGE